MRVLPKHTNLELMNNFTICIISRAYLSSIKQKSIVDWVR